MSTDKEVEQLNKVTTEVVKKVIHYGTHPDDLKKDLQDAAEKALLEAGRRVKNGEVHVPDHPSGPGPRRQE